MKIRTGFVSNSSSSSFVCDLCSRIETGWDMSIEDAEMIVCVNGHTICIEEMMQDFDKPSEISIEKQKEVLLDWWRDYDDRFDKLKAGEMSDSEIRSSYDQYVDENKHEMRYNMAEKYCPICQMIEFANSDLSLYLLKKTGITREEVFNIVKQANKRRKKLYDNEYVMYVLQKNKTEMSDLVEEIRGRFKTYREFKEFIK